MGLIRSKCYKFIKKLKKSFPRRQVFIPPFKQRLFCRYLLGMMRFFTLSGCFCAERRKAVCRVTKNIIIRK